VEATRQRLDELIKSQHGLDAAASKDFAAHDANEDKTLQRSEVEAMVRDLAVRYQIPMPDKTTLERLFNKFDTAGTNEIPQASFRDFYREILCFIKQSYYPPVVRFRREFFIQEKQAKLDDFYTREDKLGQGQFGIVFKVREKRTGTGEMGLFRCCKTISKSKTTCPRELIANEIDVLRRLDHPNIVRMYEAFEDYQNLYLIFELIDGKELLDIILDLARAGQAFDEARAARVLRSVLSAIAHCHSNRVMHKDLKPENIMILNKDLDVLDAGSVKMIDFGLAEMFTPGHVSTTAAGTPYYMSPEVFHHNFNYKCDVWSVGVLLYLMLTAHLPFDAPNKEEYIKVVTNQPVSFPDHLFKNISKEAVELLKRLLEKKVELRPTAAQALDHPWFQKFPDKARGSNRRLGELTRQGTVFQVYAQKDCFTRICLNLVAMHMEYSAVRRAPRVFKALDIDHDGMISEEEMTKALQEIGCPEEDIPRIIDALDSDGSGTISYSEFLAALLSKGDLQFEQSLWSAFRKFDLDGDGTISREELYKLLTSTDAVQIDRDRDTINKILEDLDKNKDGLINFDEFKSYLMNQIGRTSTEDDVPLPTSGESSPAKSPKSTSPKSSPKGQQKSAGGRRGS